MQQQFFLMKKVRFESLNKMCANVPNENLECHSPRPFSGREFCNVPFFDATRYYHGLNRPFPDAVIAHELSNSCPYPNIEKTEVNNFTPNIYNKDNNVAPSSELDLSMLDGSAQEPRLPLFSKSVMLKPAVFEPESFVPTIPFSPTSQCYTPEPVLRSIENIQNPQNTVVKDNSFFLRKDNIEHLQFLSQKDKLIKEFKLNSVNCVKNNKAEMFTSRRLSTPCTPTQNGSLTQQFHSSNNYQNNCNCNHYPVQHEDASRNCLQNVHKMYRTASLPENCCCMESHNHQKNGDRPIPTAHSNSVRCFAQPHTHNEPVQKNAVEQKTWAIEMYEQNKNKGEGSVEKQLTVNKEKREPTVADLFKIIKLQNEQLQLLQEKVDRFISSSSASQPIKNPSPPVRPIQNYVTEQVTVQTVESDNQMISIGVMTSFEMIRTSTSTIINKEVTKQSCKQNAQVQCNKSEITVNEGSKRPVVTNFLEGIAPVAKSTQIESFNNESNASVTDESCSSNSGQRREDRKTYNDLSLYNVQVDNATTPQLSPDQTLYLDVRDYSGSDSDGNQSNVGWTYYNKVMTHVNGMLQESDMPSSASALYRNARQRLHMQIDKTNISVTKRVNFVDQQQMNYQQPIAPGVLTDTSMKMHQLAAKYLKNVPPLQNNQLPQPRVTANAEMSFATRNYMERHQLLPGMQPPLPTSPVIEMPRFLDITALKKQPKLL